MINSITGSAASLNYLSASLDEHMGHVRQNLQQAGMNASPDRGARSTTSSSPGLVGSTPVASNATGRAEGINNLNRVPVMGSLLYVGEAEIHLRKPGHLLSRSSDNPYERDASENEDNREKNTEKNNHALAELIELQATQTLVETSLMIQQEGLCTDFIVAVVHVNPYAIDYSSLSFKQMTMVVGLDQENTQISVHTTFLSCNAEGNRKIKSLPGQLLWGGYTHSSDWVAMHCVKERPDVSETLWRLRANAFQDELVGVGIVNGNIPELGENGSNISFHIPGIAHLWASNL
jgi:hypothetical protein